MQRKWEKKEEQLLENNKVYNKDILEYFSIVPDKSIDLFILDPPYYRVVGDKWDNQWFTIDEWIAWCDKWIAEVNRTSKLSGSVWLFGFPYQLMNLFPIMIKNGFTFRQQIVVNKGLQAVAGRTSKNLKMFPTATESIFFFHKECRDHIRNILQSERKKLGWNGNQVNEQMGGAISGGGQFSCMASEKKPLEHRVYPTRSNWEKLSKVMNLPPYDDLVYKFNLQAGLTDVWDDINFYDRKVKKIHSTQKPIELINRLVTTSSNKSDLICDPFMGSGTTAISSIDNQRNFTGCELDKEYFKYLNERIKNTNNLENFM